MPSTECSEHFYHDHVVYWPDSGESTPSWLFRFHVCSECGSTFPMEWSELRGRHVIGRRNILRTGVYLCNSCIGTCQNCGERFIVNHDADVQNHCQNCIENVVECTICDVAMMMPPEHSHRRNVTISGEVHEYICHDCNSSLRECPACERLFLSSDHEWREGRNGECRVCSESRHGSARSITTHEILTKDTKCCTYVGNRPLDMDALRSFYEDTSDTFHCAEHPQEKLRGWKKSQFGVRDNRNNEFIVTQLWDVIQSFVFGSASKENLDFNENEKSVEFAYDSLIKSLEGITSPVSLKKNMEWQATDQAYMHLRNSVYSRVDHKGAKFTKKLVKLQERMGALFELVGCVKRLATCSRVQNSLHNMQTERVRKSIERYLTQGSAVDTIIDVQYGYDDEIMEVITQFNIDVGSCQYPGNSNSYGWGYGSLYTSDMALILLYNDGDLIGRSVVRYFFKDGKKYVMPDRLYTDGSMSNNMDNLVSGIYQCMIELEPDTIVIAPTSSKHEGTTIAERIEQAGKLALTQESHGTIHSRAFKPVFNKKSPYDGHNPAYYNDSGTYPIACISDDDELWYKMAIDNYVIVSRKEECLPNEI